MRVTAHGTLYVLWMFFWTLTAFFFVLTFPFHEPIGVNAVYGACVGFSGGKLAHWLFQVLFPV